MDQKEISFIHLFIIDVVIYYKKKTEINLVSHNILQTSVNKY